jgi:tRNA (cytidine/uridine-2'-O-)-methyltransferase
VRSFPRLHIVLFQPEIPQNTGNIGRTCVALDAKLWLVRPFGFQLDTQKLRRAGLDYWDHLDWEAADNWEKLTAQLPTERMWYFTRWGTTPYTTVSYTAGDVLVFGSESAGLPSTILDSVPEDRRLRIPTSDKVRSLNLSNAVAIAAYEAYRQFP